MHGEPGQRGTPFAGAGAAPYSPAERAELAAIAAAQRDPAKRRSALALVVFGIGAGLRPGELAALRGSDVTRPWPPGSRFGSAGAAARVVPVAPRYAGRAAGLARGAGAGSCSGPGRPTAATRTSSPTSPARLAADPAAPRLTMSRCRSSFICGHLADGTPVGELLAITGICQAESLARYARHVEDAPSKAVLRAWDRTQRAR